MSSVPWPSDEAGRLAELQALHALDVLPEPSFTAIAALAAFACRAPIALVNLISATGQHFKGCYGTAAPGMDRRIAFCPHAICERSLLEVPDALADPRFRDDPLVSGEPYVRFYAGVPVLSHDHALGTVCVMDHRPRRLSDDQRQALATLANDAVGLLQLHHHAARTDQVLARLRRIDAVKNQFLRTVNHELRTPLASIRSSVQLVRDGDLDPATQERFLEMIDRNSLRLEQLLDELLLMASLNAGSAAFTPARVNLAALARDAVHAVTAQGRTGQLAMAVHAPPAVMAWADPGRVRHALAHLVDNAVKFTPPGGAVTVTVTAGPAPAVEVVDTGIGIEEHDLEHVFDDFYRGDGTEDHAIGGTGVGLALVKKIARMHGGDVRIDSRPGAGTRVRLTLAVAPRNAVPAT
ncbi:GAF domain-containing sensor histidine kinase [Planomonospora sp. ID91781]|uniref:GAF domain-containing sensor histidine kinase n=1 Tax=Planomonospora sp. ID91781 TaxID=2738135 RepID=UPI0018C43218|nr:GAF domain-containing sensor histidine kinase [Planomonospora sp. ID91781]MBG0821878.1 GAF domain-containing sensor histidine kinase [Planomonospora sp. ID91781]